MHPTKKHEVWGISMEDFGIHWVGGVCKNYMGIPTGFSVSMGIEIQLPRQF